MRLFFENKFFDFLSEADYVEVSTPSCESRNTPILHIGQDEVPTPEELLAAVGDNRSLVILAPDGEAAGERFCAQMPIVRAAGGLVENEKGDILIITRKGWRDLPKGHIDEGESAEEAALREVQEETGLQEAEIVAPLCTTRHFHCAYGRWEVKQTEWFLMFAPGEEPALSPEEGESISAAEWLGGRRLWQAVDESYSTIKVVFEEFLKYKVGN
ncbi:MAG: NUDIX domain-containing protein [Tidjanibacter sp.]|nr:NUDIX domain-containing protein [Tidjanibacter sp.]